MKIIIIIVAFISINVYSQKKIKINGLVIEDIEISDSIVFHKGNLPIDLYETTNIKSYVNKNKFKIEGKFNYPHMYYLSIYSENSKIPFRQEMYFIDNTTKIINISKSSNIIAKNNSVSLEYYEKFIPFMIKNVKITFLKFRHTQPEQFDLRIKEYIIKNNNSYVALWNLAELINKEGFKKEYIEILSFFSNDLKESRLWINISNQLNYIQIRLDEKFPKIELKNTNLETVKLILPQKKHVLIDFWFSRCKPCLEQIPVLKDIYNNNRDIFEIIAVSTDKTENIEVWKKRINEKEINWINYLDENGTFALSQKINSFPTNFLLDEKGYIIKKNISLEELKELLNN
jgi:thiol-disulfide isomerase/thioredoxin